TTYYSYGDTHERVVDNTFTDEELCNEVLNFRQECKINIYQKEVNPEFNIILTPMANKSKTKVYLFVDPKSKIPLTNQSIEKMKNAILIKKLRLGFFVNIFEEKLEQEIKVFLKFLQDEKFLKKPYRILAAKGVEPEQTTESKMIFYYQSKKRKNSDFFNEVFEDELVAEYIKGIGISGGRSCLGKYIEPVSGEQKSVSRADYDTKSIEVEENEKSILYYARFEGEVSFDNKILTVMARENSIRKKEDTSKIVVEEEKKSSPKYTHHIEKKKVKPKIEVVVEKEETVQAYKHVGVEEDEIVHAYKHVGAEEKEVVEAYKHVGIVEEENEPKIIHAYEHSGDVVDEKESVTYNLSDEDDFAHRMLNILVVDDALIIRKSLKRMLEEIGHTVVAESKDGLESIKDYQKHKPELVTMDITMPNMDGIEAVGEIKKIDPDARIIMVTSHGQEDMVIGAINAGATGYLLKPITPAKIQKELDKFSKKYHENSSKKRVHLDADEDDDFDM
ncbi:MAG: response regulator, partial [Campylobacterota bacterium]|nr:response regulator [Campylobacterota bacterium]